MKATSILIFCFLSLYSFGQTTVDRELFDRADNLRTVIYETDISSDIESNDSIKSNQAKKIKTQILILALKNYQKIIDSFPTSKYVNISIYRKATANESLGNETEAINNYLKFYNSVGAADIVGENYNTYLKYDVAIRLAENAMKDKNFKLAVKYLDESKTYKYSACLNAIIDRDNYRKSLYQICDSELNKKKK
ncbi:tetratricopeptide repeat protein [Flavobacterium sp.]|uniref:tetratricopeptide repeat protein n=1 Tax=Flavobacterium sp. TaxID=239 RepID=UPI0039E4979B